MKLALIAFAVLAVCVFVLVVMILGGATLLGLFEEAPRTRQREPVQFLTRKKS